LVAQSLVSGYPVNLSAPRSFQAEEATKRWPGQMDANNIPGLVMTDLVQCLSKVKIFADLTKDQLERLAERTRIMESPKGEIIIREGDRDSRLFIVTSGTVVVIKNLGMRTERELAAFGPYGYFGEMALIDDMERSATVKAREDTRLLTIDKMDLQGEIRENPSMSLSLLKMMSQRVRTLQTNLTNNLGGLLPICLHCKDIRDEDGAWVRIEDYVSLHSNTDFSHGMCPKCLKELYPKHFGDT
jgi:CRP-like cAMP-binding protein